MSHEALGSSAVDLRRAFDQSFAERHAAKTEALEELLAIRVGGEAYAVRLSEIASLHVDPPVVSLPSRSPELLGIAGFRGVMVPVYDLRPLLGHASGPPPRWLVLVRGKQPVGLAFDRFERHLRTSAASVSSAAASGAAALPYVRGIVRDLGGARALIHVAALVEAIARRSHADGPHKEQ